VYENLGWGGRGLAQLPTLMLAKEVKFIIFFKYFISVFAFISMTNNMDDQPLEK